MRSRNGDDDGDGLVDASIMCVCVSVASCLIIRLRYTRFGDKFSPKHEMLATASTPFRAHSHSTAIGGVGPCVVYGAWSDSRKWRSTFCDGTQKKREIYLISELCM